ncbi:leukotriene B4 receptor 2b [Pseudoliparis swirei]|uniref:leukotriene B4 receptor 2b n=1 Tax=Pseudoliparis swirei TaxID=2059687 RepID=UPI0024BE76E1|nr:leukotriene B4 receptor 2b [Pseudoliparis swirei]
MNNSSSSLLSFLNETHNHERDSVVSNDFSTILGAVILSLVFLLGVPGNLFIVWSILARTHHRSVTTLLILNLAFADGCLMALTIFFIIYLAKQTWVFGDAMCKGVFYLCNTNMYASIFLITLMSVHRLVAVVFHRKMSSLITTRIVRRVVVGLWVLVMVISIPSLVFRDVREDKDGMGTIRLVCAPNHTRPRHVRFQYALETVSGFILPYAVIITSYVLILWRLRQTKFRRTVRSENLILAIVVTFGIFWLPYHVINMMEVAAQWYNLESPTRETLINITKTSRAVTSAFAFISSCANPVLYTFAGKSYIKQNGFAFMARLFEGTSMDQTGTKKSNTVGNSTADSGTGTRSAMLQSNFRLIFLSFLETNNRMRIYQCVRFQYALETVSGFILPYAVIITSYVLILWRLRQTKFRRTVRSENLILAIVVTFGIFWLPYHVINMMEVAAQWYNLESPTRETLINITKTSRAVTSAFAFISSCANPVLYTFAGKSYIKQNGFAFMARLFEGTSMDQTGTKKSNTVGNSTADSGTGTRSAMLQSGT